MLNSYTPLKREIKFILTSWGSSGIMTGIIDDNLVIKQVANGNMYRMKLRGTGVHISGWHCQGWIRPATRGQHKTAGYMHAFTINNIPE